MILILGDPRDLHIRKVGGHLEKMDAHYEVVDPFETVVLPDVAHPTSSKKVYTAIWDRLKPLTVPKSNRGQYVWRERVAAIRTLQLLHRPERLMNSPSATEAARSKALQLSIARKVGLDTPKTYIGNNAKTVRDFIASCSRGAVAKSLTWFFDSDNRFSFTNIITLDALGSEPTIAYCPMIYQEYIPKDFELRITCVGRSVFAAKVFSQNNPKAIVDWRRDQFNLDYEVTKLPTWLERKMTLILKALGLKFGAFDFIVTPEGKYIFLEVNSSGNWLWLEEQLSLPISCAVAHWLRAASVAQRCGR